MKRIIISLVILVSSSRAGAASDLSITFQDNNAVLIDGQAASCTVIAGSFLEGEATNTVFDVTSKFFQLLRPQIHWANPDKHFNVDKVVVQFSDLGISPQQCVIQGAELSSLFASGWSPQNYLPWDFLLLPNSTAPAWSKCQQLTCGGFTVDPNISVFKGTVTVIGSSVEDVFQSREESSTPIIVQNVYSR